MGFINQLITGGAPPCRNGAEWGYELPEGIAINYLWIFFGYTYGLWILYNNNNPTIIYTQRIHGAGIFTYIYPQNGPVM